ncbi:hypothetical protein SALBM311S_03827 [Streptomyces alboniger]
MAAETGHRQHGLGRVAEGDQGDRVVVAQSVRHHAEGLLGEVEAARFGHGAGDVDDEGEGGGRAFAGPFGGAGGEADADQGPVLVVGAGAVDGHREAVAVGAFVVLAEAVDEFLGSDRRGVGPPPVGEGAAGVAVGGGVDVEGEGGEVVGGRGGLARAVVRVVLLTGAAAGGGSREAGRPVRAVRAAVVRGVVRTASREKQATRRGEREQGGAQPSYSVPLHGPCPLGQLTPCL